MSIFLSKALAPALTALFASFFISPLVIRLAWRLKIIDHPKKDKHPKKIHTYPVPRGGGLSIFAAILLASLIFLPFDKHMIGIITGAFLITLLGTLDDKYDLNPYLRLLIQFISAAAPIAAGIGISFITVPFHGILDLSHPQINFMLFNDPKSIWLLSDLFALFWIVALMNFLNMGAKGVDGQLPGVVSIAGATIAALSLRFSADITQWPVIILASIVTGAYLGFLPFNMFPQKIMPSFSGSSLAGYFLGILSILSTTKVGTLFVVLAVPLIDTGYTIVRRLAQGKSPVWGDAGHLHHKLLERGWPKRKVSYFYWTTTAVMGILALNLNSSYKFYTIVGIVVLVGGLLLWLANPKQKK